MFAIVAAACFLLAFFGVKAGGKDLVVLGLLFLAIQLIWPVGVVPARWRREP